MRRTPLVGPRPGSLHGGGVLVGLLLCALAGCAGAPPTAALGGIAGCPPTPNCVSTAAPPDDAEHYGPPLAYAGDVAAAKARMKAIVAGLPRAELVAETENGLRFTFTSALFRFVDDVDVVFEGGQVQYRSASRVGRGDMGVNRKRVEAIARAWAEAQPDGAPAASPTATPPGPRDGARGAE